MPAWQMERSLSQLRRAHHRSGSIPRSKPGLIDSSLSGTGKAHCERLAMSSSLPCRRPRAASTPRRLRPILSRQLEIVRLMGLN